MKLEIYTISRKQMKELILHANDAIVSDNEIETLDSVAMYSVPLLAAMYGDRLLAVFGFVPQTVLSTTAHLWVYSTPTVNRHKLIFARASANVIDNMLDQYSEIIGYCFTEKAMSWVRWLGGEFSTGNGRAYPFTIRRR